MEITTTIDDGSARHVALARALAAYNASNPPLTQTQFLQRIVDGQMDNLVASYAVAEMDKTTWLKERFTQAERAAIRTAAMTNGAIADLCSLVDGTSIVHFDDPVTIGGIAALEAAGLIAEGRGAEILAF